MQKIFISYSRKDADFVRKLAIDLETAGYDVWWDITDLRGGDDWVRVIPEAISSSPYFIVVLTPNSIESEWVRKEYTQALNLRKKIIPIMLVPCDVPFALNTINFVNFSAGEYADNFNKLLVPLGYSGQPPVVTPYKKAALPSALLKFGIPSLIGLVLLVLAFAWTSGATPAQTPSSTPPRTATVTDQPPAATDSPVPPTASPTLTGTATATRTLTPSPSATWTVSPTLFYEIKLPICITAESPNIYVRSGPGQRFAARVLDLRDDSGRRLDVCPSFSAQITVEGETWLLVAPGQSEAALREFEGGWIRRDLLDKNIPVDILPSVTLTPTPTPSNTPTITPSPTPTPTVTPTSTLVPTDTDIPTETPTP